MPPRAAGWQRWGVQHASGCTFPNATKGGELAGMGSPARQRLHLPEWHQGRWVGRDWACPEHQLGVGLGLQGPAKDFFLPCRLVQVIQLLQQAHTAWARASADGGGAGDVLPACTLRSLQPEPRKLRARLYACGCDAIHATQQHCSLPCSILYRATRALPALTPANFVLFRQQYLSNLINR